ncbi:MAG: site-specific integrase [Nocardioidaceae bacterium]
MGRPALPLGTCGSIRVYRTPTGHKARTLVRDFDGVTRAVERNGRSKAAAVAALKLAIRDRAAATGDDIRGDTRVHVLAEAWYESLSNLSPTTMEAYRYRLDQQVLPGLGQLRVRELRVGTLDRHLRAVATKHGAAAAKMTRSVLSGICGLAARLDALDRNPVRDIGSTSRSSKVAPRALTVAEVRALRTALAEDGKAVARDLSNLVGFLLATGLRIGEASAVRWDDVDLTSGTVAVKATVVRVKGEGLLAKSTKSDAGTRTLVLPDWCVALLQRRQGTARALHTSLDGAPIFPAASGGWRDPSNTQSDLREAFNAAGYPWVTSHVFRKTVATLMDQAGLSSRATADQLGHANPSLAQDVYYGRKVASTGAARALEILQ